MVLAGCSSTTPISAPDSTLANPAGPETGLTSQSENLSPDNPAVVLPPSADLERRKELAKLLPSPADSYLESQPKSKTESASSVAQADKTIAGNPTPAVTQGDLKEDASANPEIQRSADPTEPPYPESPR